MYGTIHWGLGGGVCVSVCVGEGGGSPLAEAAGAEEVACKEHDWGWLAVCVREGALLAEAVAGRFTLSMAVLEHSFNMFDICCCACAGHCEWCWS
jgi:hypothetical protein